MGALLSWATTHTWMRRLAIEVGVRVAMKSLTGSAMLLSVLSSGRGVLTLEPLQPHATAGGGDGGGG